MAYPDALLTGWRGCGNPGMSVKGSHVSRLDSFIRRLQAQRACLEVAIARIADLPGPVLEFGLGNGRTYDHLRELLPTRAGPLRGESKRCKRSRNGTDRLRWMG